MQRISPRPARIGSRRQHLLAGVTVVLVSLALSLAAAEYVLRWEAAAARAEEAMDTGLVRYDPELGWRLSPGWRGRHHHADFDVEYAVGANGQRGDPGDAGHPVAVFGDSFTFGLGVSERETFVSRLSELDPGSRYVNLGVPGYSTDQEVLLMRRELGRWSPRHVLLVVYLGNDLLDIQRPFPAQADHGKPYFSLVNERLVLNNVPVPKSPKPLRASRADLAALLLPGDDSARGPMVRWLRSLELTRRLGLGLTVAPADDAFFDARLGEALALFRALIVVARDGVASGGIGMTLVLIPGQVYVARPDGHSARYQDYLRRKLLDIGAELGVPVVDAALALRKAHERGESDLYHPNEGHLSPRGHRLVARVLADHFSRDGEPTD